MAEPAEGETSEAQLAVWFADQALLLTFSKSVHVDGADLHMRQLFHGSNDGQKGMGLIMLILTGTVPPAYALNHAIMGTMVGWKRIVVIVGEK